MKSHDVQENREVVWAVVRLMNPDPDRFIFDNEWDKIVSFKRDKEARKAIKTKKIRFFRSGRFCGRGPCSDWGFCMKPTTKIMDDMAAINALCAALRSYYSSKAPASVLCFLGSEMSFAKTETIKEINHDAKTNN